jgi:hypothetical protein
MRLREVAHQPTTQSCPYAGRALRRHFDAIVEGSRWILVSKNSSALSTEQEKLLPLYSQTGHHIGTISLEKALIRAPEGEMGLRYKGRGRKARVTAAHEVFQKTAHRSATTITAREVELFAWLRPCKVAGVRDRTLYVKLPTANFSHVSEKYATLLAEVLPELKVEFVAPTPLDISKPMDAILEVARGAAAS